MSESLKSSQKLERILHSFDTFEEADAYDREFYRNLTPDERLEIALDLMRGLYEAYPRFERIYRTSELGECPVSRDWRVGLQSIRDSSGNG